MRAGARLLPARLLGACAVASPGGAGPAPDLAPPAVCGNGVCEPGEDGAACGSDCCDAATACTQTRQDDGTHYCRSMNGGPYDWYTAADTTALCADPSQLGTTTYACGGEHGTCCALPGGYVAGGCA